jgi:hypothetical protein
MRVHWLGLTALLCSTAGFARVPAWRLSEAIGPVTVVRAGVSQIASRDAVVAPGDVVRTGPKARAVLVRGQEYVLVAPGSQVRLPADEQKGAIAQVVEDAGDVIFMIRKMATPHFAVQTPYLAAVVKGTTFSVGVSSTGATVKVLEGAVDVGTVDGGAHEIVRPGNSVSVGADRLTAMRVMAGGVEHIVHSARDGGAATVPPQAAPRRGSGERPAPSGIIAAVAEAPVPLSTVTAGLVTDYGAGIASVAPRAMAVAPVALASNIGTTSAQTPQGTVAIAREGQQEAVAAVRVAVAQQQAADVAQQKAAEAARQVSEQATAAKAAADQQAAADAAAAAAAQAQVAAQQRAADQAAAKAAADAAAQQASAAQQAAAKQASDQAAAQAAAAQAAAQQQAAAQAQEQAQAAADAAAQQAAAQQAQADAAAKAAQQAAASAQASGDPAQQAAAQQAAQQAATQQAAAQAAVQSAAQQAKAASDAAAAQSGVQQSAADAAAHLQQIAAAAQAAAAAAQQATADAAARAAQAQAAQQAAAQQAAAQQAAQAAAQQAAKAADDQQKAAKDADKAAKDAQKAAEQAAKAAADAQKQAQSTSGKTLPDQASDVAKAVLGVVNGTVTGILGGKGKG